MIMKNVKLFAILLIAGFIISCSGDDNANNSSNTLPIELIITGNQTLDYKTSNVTIVVPPMNPNFLISSYMKVGAMNHTFSITLDSNWMDKTEIDLTRDANKCTFAYDGGKNGNTYVVIDGKFVVDFLSNTRVKGTVNFTAAKLGSIDTTISVVNGKIDFSK